jgi:hypothetical protein
MKEEEIRAIRATIECEPFEPPESWGDAENIRAQEVASKLANTRSIALKLCDALEAARQERDEAIEHTGRAIARAEHWEEKHEALRVRVMELKKELKRATEVRNY